MKLVVLTALMSNYIGEVSCYLRGSHEQFSSGKAFQRTLQCGFLGWPTIANSLSDPTTQNPEAQLATRYGQISNDR